MRLQSHLKLNLNWRIHILRWPLQGCCWQETSFSHQTDLMGCLGDFMTWELPSEPVVKTEWNEIFVFSQLVLRNVSVISYILMVYVVLSPSCLWLCDPMDFSSYGTNGIYRSARFSEGTTHENEYTRIYCLLLANFLYCGVNLSNFSKYEDTDPLSYTMPVQESLRVITEADYQSVSQIQSQKPHRYSLLHPILSFS